MSIVTIPDVFGDSFDTLARWIIGDLQDRNANLHEWDDTVVYALPAGYYEAHVAARPHGAAALALMPDSSVPRTSGIWFKRWDLVDPGDDIYDLVRTVMVRAVKDFKAYPRRID